MKKTSLTIDIHSLRVRKQLQYTATLISAAGADLGEVSLSRSTIHRNKQISRIEKAVKIRNKNENLMKNGDGYWVIQWDGKTLKQCVLAVG